MADLKISELPVATAPAGTELIEIVQGGVNKQTTAQDIADLGGGGGTWGSITGTLSAQTDLQSALDAKVPTTLAANTTILTGGFYLRLQGTGVQVPRLVLDAPNNVRKTIAFRTLDVARWEIHMEDNETGANAGSNLHFERLDDAGVFIDAPLVIDRATGVAAFSIGPTVPTAAAGTNTTQAASTAFVQTALTTATVVSASTSTAGATITLDMDSKIQKIHVGSATFATAKVVAMSNTTNSLSFQFIFEVTNVAAVLTVPADWLMSTPDFDGADWTPPATGKYVFGGSWNGTNWYVNAAGPYV